MEVKIKNNPRSISIEFGKNERETINTMVRNVISLYMTKIHRKYTVNWVIAKELFSEGSTVSIEICKALGVNPDGHEW